MSLEKELVMGATEESKMSAGTLKEILRTVTLQMVASLSTPAEGWKNQGWLKN